MALATTASQTTLTFSADATVEFKTTRVSPEPASPEPGSPLRTPMPGQQKEFFATPQPSKRRDDDLISMSPITPGYGLDPTPRPPSKTRFAAALDATEEAPVATPKAQRPPPSPLDSLATLSPLKEPTEGAGVAAPETARRPPPAKRSPPPPRAAPWPFFRHPAYEYRAPRVSAWASSYGTTYGATAPAWTPMPVSPTLTNLTSLYRRRVQAIQSSRFAEIYLS